jgi:hypothetical protein
MGKINEGVLLSSCGCGVKVVRCAICNKKIGKGISKNMYILSCFHPGFRNDLKFCSLRCLEEYLNLDEEDF